MRHAPLIMACCCAFMLIGIGILVARGDFGAGWLIAINGWITALFSWLIIWHAKLYDR